MRYPVNARRTRGFPIAVALIVCLAVMLAAGSVSARQLVISTLPYTVTQTAHSTDLWDTVTIAGTKLRTDSTAITFSGCHHWVFLLDRDTLVFGTDSTVNITDNWIYVNGVHISNSHDMVVKGGYILHEPANARSDEPAFRTSHLINDQNRGIQIGGPSYNILIDSMREIRVRGHANLKGTHSIWISNEAHNIHIRNSRLFNDVFAYENRGWFSATCVRFESMAMSNLTSPSDYHVWIENCYMEDNAHTAMYGSGKIMLDRDTVVVDARNLRYLVTDGNAEHGTANAYGIQFYGDCTGTYIKHCVFRAGNRYKGGRGIQLERTNGAQDNPLVICSTYVNSHESCCVYFTAAYGYFPCCIKIRNSSRWVHVFDNEFVYVGDGSVPVGWIGYGNPYYRYGHAFIYSQITFDATATPPYGITVERNLIRSIDRSGRAMIEGVAFDKCLAYDETFIWRYNRVESDSIGYRFGGYDGDGSYIRMYADTLKLVDTSSLGHLAWQVGFQSNRCGRGIVATNMAYEDTYGNAANYDTSIAFSTAQPDDISLRRTLKVFVRGNNGLPVTNATVTVRNNYNQTVVSGTTDQGGRVMGTVTSWFESRASVDSTSFNNFTLTAARSGDNAQKAMTVRWNNYKDTLTLANTTGDGTWLPDDDIPPVTTDTISPGPIIDLGAACDSADGSVILSWTATGDDNAGGLAARYEVRYSDANITEANFPAATLLPNPPVPAPSGASEEWAVTLPGGSDVYYLAIKAFDEVGNASDLAAPAEFSPGNIRSPTIDTVYVDEPNRIVTLIARAVQTCLDLHYQFQIDTVDTYATARIVTDAQPDYYARVSLNDLLVNTIYYWRCRSVMADGSEASAYTETRAFIPFVDFSTGCDVLTLLDPVDGAVIANRRPVLTVVNMNTDSSNMYIFEVAADSAFAALAATGVVHQVTGGTTSWTVSTDLKLGAVYHWRVRANTCDYSAPLSFQVAGSEQGGFAYPNPFNLSSGTPVTFSDLPVGSTVTIMTVSGDIVRRWEEIAGDIHWSGDNQSGNTVASGVYLWFIEPSGANGKLIVVR